MRGYVDGFKRLSKKPQAKFDLESWTQTNPKKKQLLEGVKKATFVDGGLSRAGGGVCVQEDVGFTPWVKNVKGTMLKDQNGS